MGGGRSTSSAYGESESLASMLGFSNSSSSTDSFSSSFSDTGSSTFLDPLSKKNEKKVAGMAFDTVDPTGAQKRATKDFGLVRPEARGALLGASKATDVSEMVAAEEKGLQAGLADLYNNTIEPEARAEAIAAGGLGGGRQGVAEAEGLKGLASVFATKRGEIMSRANETAYNAREQVGSLSDRIMSLGQMPFTAGMSQLSGLSDILGSPTVLSESSGTSGSGSVSTGKSKSKSKTKSKQRSKSVESAKSDDTRFSFT